MILYPSDRNARAAPPPSSAAQAAEQEPAVVAGQPAVDVRVVQAGLLLAHPPQVGGRDAELVGDPLIAHLGRQRSVPAVIVTPSGPSTGVGAVHHQPRALARIAAAGATMSTLRAC